MQTQIEKRSAIIIGTAVVAIVVGGFYLYTISNNGKKEKKGKSKKKEDKEEGREQEEKTKEKITEYKPSSVRSASTVNVPPRISVEDERDATYTFKPPTSSSGSSRRKFLDDQKVTPEQLYVNKKKSPEAPYPTSEGRASPKESRDPSKRGIQLNNWGSATHRDFLANAKPRNSIYPKSLKIEKLEKDAVDDKIFRKTLDHIGVVLLSKSRSIRKIFRSLDTKYYGYLSAEAFRKMLDDPELGLLELTTDEKDTIVRYCDATDGKIDYKEFFTTFFEQTIKKQLRTQGKGTLKQIFVIARHGSRFPIHPIPLNSGWSSNEHFWKLYGGKLTPKGINQHYKLGTRLRESYLQELRLLPDSHILPEMLHVYTSNTDRTILSASSLLDGMFPYVSQSFVVEDEPDLTSRNYQGIRIHIANTARKFTPVLHGYKGNPKLDYLKKKAFENATLFKEAAKDPKYHALLEKLWEMTNHECISPDKELVKRFSHMGPLYNQIAIERALKMQLFANTKNIYLTHSDEELLENLAEESRHVHFTGNNPEDQREIGRAGAGLLPFAIIDSFKKRINNLITRDPPRKKIVLFSAHDYTIMALLSHFGFRNWALPNFAAYVILELHYINGKYYVRLCYNPDPAQYKKPSELRDYMISTQCIDMSDAQKGMIEYTEFERILIEVKRSFVSEEDWYNDAHSLDELIEEEKKKNNKI